MKVAVVTPTFNRAYSLKKLYKSLVQQTNNNFVWYVIDDGSTDDTKNLIRGFEEEQKIKINYFYQSNGGKHRALNYAAQQIEEELVFMVDSDDWITPDAIESIINKYEEYKNNNRIAVLSFRKAYSDGTVSGPTFSKNEFIGNHIDYRVNKHIRGEHAEVIRTKCFKEYPFPNIDGEKFIGEGYLWMSVAKKYDTVYINKTIYLFEYLDNGLTKNIRKNRFKNPKGVVEVCKQGLNKRVALVPRTKDMIRYIAYGKIAGYKMKELLDKNNCKLLFLAMTIPGLLYATKERIEEKYEK